MSVLGTSIAAGVAQTAHNAQQVARQQDKRRNDAARASHEVRDRYEHLIQDLEEGDDASTAARVAIDDQVPDHEPPHDRPDEEEEAGAAKPAPQPLLSLASSAEAQAVRQRIIQQHGSAAEGSLYRHLDIEA